MNTEGPLRAVNHVSPQGAIFSNTNQNEMPLYQLDRGTTVLYISYIEHVFTILQSHQSDIDYVMVYLPYGQ